MSRYCGSHSRWLACFQVHWRMSVSCDFPDQLFLRSEKPIKNSTLNVSMNVFCDSQDQLFPTLKKWIETSTWHLLCQIQASNAKRPSKFVLVCLSDKERPLRTLTNVSFSYNVKHLCPDLFMHVRKSERIPRFKSNIKIAMTAMTVWWGAVRLRPCCWRQGQKYMLWRIVAEN